MVGPVTQWLAVPAADLMMQVGRGFDSRHNHLGVFLCCVPHFLQGAIKLTGSVLSCVVQLHSTDAQFESVSSVKSLCTRDTLSSIIHVEK